MTLYQEVLEDWCKGAGGEFRRQRRSNQDKDICKLENGQVELAKPQHFVTVKAKTEDGRNLYSQTDQDNVYADGDVLYVDSPVRERTGYRKIGNMREPEFENTDITEMEITQDGTAIF